MATRPRPQHGEEAAQVEPVKVARLPAAAGAGPRSWQSPSSHGHRPHGCRAGKAGKELACSVKARPTVMALYRADGRRDCGGGRQYRGCDNVDITARFTASRCCSKAVSDGRLQAGGADQIDERRQSLRTGAELAAAVSVARWAPGAAKHLMNGVSCCLRSAASPISRFCWTP